MTTATMPNTMTGESLGSMMEAGALTDDKHYFGEITIVDDWDCALVKGAGKVPFDPQQHTSRLIALKLQVTCQMRDGTPYTIEQDDITSGSKHKVTLPTLDTLGVKVRPQLKTLVGKFCHVVKVPTGKKYLARKDSLDGRIKTGDMLPEMAFKFEALFDTAEQCQAAERAFYTPRSTATDRNVPQPLEQPAIDAAARQALLGTLPQVWQAISGQPNPAAMLGTILAGNPAYAQHGITLESDEVQVLIGNVPF